MPVKMLTPNRAMLIFCTAIIVSLFQLLLLQRDNGSHVSCTDDLNDILRGPIDQDDPRLIEWISNQIYPPSAEPYNLNLTMSGLPEEYYLNTTYSISQEFILGVLQDIFFKSPSNGKFFVEAGAYDGEFLSNSLLLEKTAGWRGLLIEPNKKIFQKLLTKHRKAYSINACLSTKPFPSQEMFGEMQDSGKKDYFINKVEGSPVNAHEKDYAINAGMGSSGLIKYLNKSDSNLMIGRTEEVQCLPLYSMLSALNVRHVDFFSLDVEGPEIEILKTIPWNLISFTMLAIEHYGKYEELGDFMENKGYFLHKYLYPDFVFFNKKFTVVKSAKTNMNKRKKYWRKT